MGWTGTQIKSFVAATTGKIEPLAIAAEVFANVVMSDFAKSTVAGNPTVGTFEAGDLVIGVDEVMWLCVIAGTPGTWISSSGSIYPTTTFSGKPADPVADIAALKAVTAAQREDKQVRLVEAVNKHFRFDTSSTLTGDDIYVVAPTSGTGRWIWVDEDIALTGVTYVATNGKTAAQGADGSAEKPYSTIAAGLAAGGLVLAAPGTYTEVAPLSAVPAAGAVLRSMGGAVTITVAGGKVGVIGAGRSLRVDGLISVAGVTDVNAVELADGGGGSATSLILLNGAAITSLGTGHAVAVLGKGSCVNSSGVINAGGTGNGMDLANHASASYTEGPTGTVGSSGGVPLNVPALASASLTNNPPIGSTLTGTVTVSGVLATATYTLLTIPAATGVPAGTIIRVTDFPTSEGGFLMSNGTKWLVKDFQPKTIVGLADADASFLVAAILASDVLNAAAYTGPHTVTLDTAANIVAGLVGCAVGTDVEFVVSNPSGSSCVIAVGAGGTLVGSGTVLAGTVGRFKMKITNTAAPAYNLYRTAADVIAAVDGPAAGKKMVYGTAVIDPAAATDDLTCTGLSAVENIQVTLVSDPVLAEITWVTATLVGAPAGHATVKGWRPTAGGDTTPAAGSGKAGVGTTYYWLATGTA